MENLLTYLRLPLPQCRRAIWEVLSRVSPHELPLGLCGVRGYRPRVNIETASDVRRLLLLAWEREPMGDVAEILERENISCFVDVGAAGGAYALLAAEVLDRDKQVFAIEPDVNIFSALQKNVSLNNFDHVQLKNIALGNYDGEAHLSYEGPAPHLVSKEKGAISAPITIRKLDSLIASKEIHMPSFIKIDVEGAEGLVLEGMRDALTSGAIKYVLMEHHPDEMTIPFGYSAADVQAMLHTLNLQPMRQYVMPRGKLPMILWAPIN